MVVRLTHSATSTVQLRYLGTILATGAEIEKIINSLPQIVKLLSAITSVTAFYNIQTGHATAQSSYLYLRVYGRHSKFKNFSNCFVNSQIFPAIDIVTFELS